MLGKMDIARDKARAAGVVEDLVGTNGEPSLTFHSFLFLVRMIHRVADHAEVDRDAMMVQRTGFTQTEITEFHEIFSFWAKKVAKLEADAMLREDEDNDMMEMTSSPTLTDLMKKDHAEEGSEYLSLDGMQRVVRSLGLHMNHDEKKVLIDKIGNLPRSNSRKFEFLEFLLLMRWMLDTNFSTINAVLRPHASQAATETEGSK